jgi:hypothetical protein
VVHNRYGQRLQGLPWWEALGVASSTGLEHRLDTGVHGSPQWPDCPAAALLVWLCRPASPVPSCIFT